MRATVVIGAAFGDEGKGVMVHHYASQQAATVVRFSGGANSGHTVVDGKRRHVFGHFGAGTLADAPTFLSKYFVVNPLLWQTEAAELAAIGVDPILMIDADAPLTIPYDMMINQWVEESRGDARHGSCGVGINETVRRYKRASNAYGTKAALLLFPDAIADYLKYLRATSYFLQRMDELGLTPTDEQLALLNSDDVIDQYVDAAHKMLGNAEIGGPYLLPENPIIFEGSQGLLLDEDHRFFPHVTHAKTGLHNVLEMAKVLRITEFDVTYVVRAYMTRHGAGPFPTEDKAMHYEDRTNVNGDWQGALRFGRLDLDLIGEAVRADIASAGDIKVNPTLAVTCLDQIEGADSGFIWDLMKACGIKNVKLCFNPEGDNIISASEERIGELEF